MFRIFIAFAVVLLTTLAAYIILEIRAVNIKSLPVAEGATRQQRIVELENWLQELGRSGHFSGSVLIAHKSEILLESNIGKRSAKGPSITPKTTFNIASVTKHFTAAAILLLQSRDKLALDDPLHMHLSELKQFENVTIRHLLVGTSGLPDYVAAADQMLLGTELLTNQKLIRWLSSQKPNSTFQVGQTYAYSNTAYVVLSEIIERVSGQPFHEFMQQHLFTPAKMTNTTIYRQNAIHPAMKNLATSMKKRFFYFGDYVDQPPSQLDGVAGDGNIITSPRDLEKWHNALLDGSVIPAADYREALTIQTTDDGTPIIEHWGNRDLYLGLGWNLYKDRGDHDSFGSWNGYQNYFYRAPEKDLTIIVLANAAHFIPFSMIVDELKGYVLSWQN